jgi:hypothetical protein
MFADVDPDLRKHVSNMLQRDDVVLHASDQVVHTEVSKGAHFPKRRYVLEAALKRTLIEHSDPFVDLIEDNDYGRATA